MVVSHSGFSVYYSVKVEASWSHLFLSYFMVDNTAPILALGGANFGVFPGTETQ